MKLSRLSDQEKELNEFTSNNSKTSEPDEENPICDSRRINGPLRTETNDG